MLGASVPVFSQEVNDGGFVSSITPDMRPITKVITLLTEMKAQVEKEAKEDEAAYNEYKCWCDTNRKQKTEAIESAEATIADLNAFLEEADAKEAELKTEIAQLEADIAEDQEAIATASAIREKEHAAFLAEEADLKETVGALAEAVKVLQKVQLLQKEGKKVGPSETAALLQVRNIIQRHGPTYHSVMQKDLFDVLSSLEAMVT